MPNIVGEIFDQQGNIFILAFSQLGILLQGGIWNKMEAVAQSF